MSNPQLPTIQERLSRGLRTLQRNDFVRRVSVLVGGSAAANLITLAVTPLVTRLFTPSELGTVGVFIAYVSFCSALMGLRYENAILVAVEEDDLRMLTLLVLAINFIFAIGLSSLFWLLRGYEFFGLNIVPAWLGASIGIVALGLSMFMLARVWCVRLGMVTHLSRAMILRAALNAIIRVVGGFFGCGLAALFLAEFFGAWGAMGQLASRFRSHLKTAGRRVKLAAIGRVAVRYRKFPLIESPSAVLNALTLNLPVPLVAALFGAAEAGFFALALRLASLPIAQFGNALGDVFVFRFSEHVRAERAGEARRLFWQVFLGLSVIGIPAFATIMLLAPFLFPFLFGAPWKAAGWITTIISPWLLAGLIVSPLSRILSVLQRQELKLIYDLTSLTLLSSAFIVSKVMGFSLYEFCLCISAAGVGSYLIYLGVIVYALNMRSRSVHG